VRRSVLALALSATLLAACGSSSSSGSTTSSGASATTASATTTPTTAPAFPVQVKAANGTVTIATRPTRIVSLSPTATEMLFAVDAGPQVAAVDDQSNYPADAPRTKLSGLTPNLEAIAGKRPDLVVVSNDINGVVAGLRRLTIPTLLMTAAATLDDTYAQIDALGRATGHGGQAADVVNTMKGKIALLRARVPTRSEPLTYFHELDDTYYTVTSKTFIGQVYGLVGLRNIADAADKTGTGYPQLSAEYIVKANPDLVFLADAECCHQNAKTVAARPGWSGLAAVKDGGVVVLDGDVASRWGPRVVDFLTAVVGATTKVPAATG
jgi:iron complex transport system substrate-binding protein